MYLFNFIQNETTDQTASESCQSSDEDSEADVILGLKPAKHSIAELVSSSQAGISSSPTAHVPLIDHLDMPVSIMKHSILLSF